MLAQTPSRHEERAMAEVEQRQELRIDSQEDLELLREVVAEDPDVELEVVREVPGIAPLFIIAVIGAAAAVAGAIADYTERRKGGQIIDLREGQQLTRRDKSVVYGLIVIVAADGKVTVEVKEPKGFFGQVLKDVLDALQGIATKSIEAAAAAVKGAVGDHATVKTEPGAVV
jgi:hypothetical protein